MTDRPTPPPVLQVRLVVEAPDVEEALVFDRDVRGLPVEGAFNGPEIAPR